MNSKFQRKYSINEDYFKEWSSNMAYILGFTTADGCVNFNPTKWVYSLSYGLNKDDIEILEFIRSEICPTKPISQPNKQDMVRLEFNSKTLCNDLIGEYRSSLIFVLLLH